jgi:hypothetical protein
VGDKILVHVQKSQARIECALDLSKLYPSRIAFEEFRKRYEEFRCCDQWNEKVYKLKGRKLLYRSEQLVPAKSNGKPPLLLVFGNPATHSVEAGCFFAFKDGRENPFWRSLLGKAGIIKFPSGRGTAVREQNATRAKQILSLEYESPFRVGFCVYFSMPSPAGGKHSGVAGIRKLLHTGAWRIVIELEKARILHVTRNFMNREGIVVTFQKSAWEGLRSENDPFYSISKARGGGLRGVLRGMPHVRLLGAPPTRLIGPARDALRRLLSEEGCDLMPEIP